MHPNQQTRKILYKVASGSQLYGTTLPTSDVDYTSVFLPTAYDLLSLQKCEFIDNSTKSSSEDRRNTQEDIDDQQHALNRYLHLLLHGNPNLTELLFAPFPIVEDERFTEIKNNYPKFISTRCYDSFTRFAISQKKKLEYKSLRFTQLRNALFLLDTRYAQQIVDPKYSMSAEMANELNKVLQEYKGSKNNVEHFHEGLQLKVIYEKIKAEHDRYGWRVHTDTFETLGYDVKFASHAIRLLYEGEQILLNGYLEFPITGKAYNDIMSIRRAEVSIEDFYKICIEYEDRNRTALEKSTLPKNPDWKYANEYLVKVLKDAIIKGEI